MRFADFMDRIGASDESMAVLLSRLRAADDRPPIHRTTVGRYRCGRSVPRWDDMTLIYQFSSGLVAPNDWLPPDFARLAVNRNQSDV